jgi:hypothetical protein
MRCVPAAERETCMSRVKPVPYRNLKAESSLYKIETGVFVLG